MELRHLRYFTTVARELHFGRAAELLGIAQPPLSQQIKSLEDELGVILIDRMNKKKIVLTAAGRVFLEEAERTLSQAERAVSMARLAIRGKVGRLTIGTIGSVLISGVLPRAMSRMRRQFPDVVLRVRELPTEEMPALLLNGELDLTLSRPHEFQFRDDAFSVHELARDRFILAVPHDHRFCRMSEVPPSELKDEPFVMVPRSLGSLFHDRFVDLCSHAGFTPMVVQEADNIHVVISLVAGGLGITVVPESLKGAMTEMVEYRYLEGVEVSVPVVVTWRRDDRSAAVKNLLDILRLGD